MVQIRWKEANENIGGSLEASGTKRKLKTRRLETHNKKKTRTNNNKKQQHKEKQRPGIKH